MTTQIQTSTNKILFDQTHQKREGFLNLMGSTGGGESRIMAGVKKGIPHPNKAGNYLLSQGVIILLLL